LIAEKLKNEMSKKDIESKLEKHSEAAKKHDDVINKLKADNKQKQENIRRDFQSQKEKQESDLKKKQVDTGDLEKKHAKVILEYKEKVTASEREKSQLEEKMNDVKKSTQQLELKNK